MTNDEKYKAIIERVKIEHEDFDKSAISMMVIMGYLTHLSKMGIVESEFKVTPKGAKVADICQEFDWKPSDQEIVAFVTAMVPAPEQAGFAHLIKRYRDERDSLVEEWEHFKKDGEI